ncbi:hypothetical protein M2401_004973 [Pseudomonas sp. JUb42]|jgi:hypothetical protein|uniref:hypothetical protein n=1 Tax=Pseudomonas sp. JUb42 TaxID=2940611 RepID=UPI002168ACB0|nr:hypothetical protein [Pseudomonas sp. JUb42]MCS3471211.1 hypothetical protein [Pseudomonas sp. JUb42]
MKGCLAFMALWMMVSAASAEENVIVIPNDKLAQYVLIDTSGSAEERMIVVKRSSMSGIVYSRRVYNCKEDTVHFLGSGLTMEALNGDQINWREQPVESDTVASDIEKIACK